jgi:hypothetical protein
LNVPLLDQANIFCDRFLAVKIDLIGEHLGGGEFGSPLLGEKFRRVARGDVYLELRVILVQ